MWFGLLPLVIWSHVFWPSAMWNLHKTQRYSKCFDLQLLSPALPNLWLLLVINMIFRLSKVWRVRDQLLEAVWDKHRGFSTTHFLCTRGFSYMESWITGQKEDYVIGGKKWRSCKETLLISSLLMQQHSGPLGLSNHWEWFSLWIFSLGSWKKLSSTTAQTSQDIDYILSA